MREVVQTDRAPKPIGPYSQAVRCGGLVFTSGQVGLDARTGEMAKGGVRVEAEQVFANLAAVLTAAGTSLQRAVKVTVFLTDMAEFALVNEVYSRFVSEPYPARSTIQVAGLPKGAAVEVEVIAEC
jgi:2-iminobutanoate/2-iminopropanoate deaminase